MTSRMNYVITLVVYPFQAPELGVGRLLTIANQDVVLRWVTFLANVTGCVRDRNIQPSSLPPNDKAASPETMYAALYGANYMQVHSKVFLLLQNENEDINRAAQKTYECFSAHK